MERSVQQYLRTQLRECSLAEQEFPRGIRGCRHHLIAHVPWGFIYLVATYLAPIKDWYGRYVAAWRLSNTLEADFCVDALKEALGQGRPEVFNTD